MFVNFCHLFPNVHFNCVKLKRRQVVLIKQLHVPIDVHTGAEAHGNVGERGRHRVTRVEANHAQGDVWENHVSCLNGSFVHLKENKVR